MNLLLGIGQPRHGDDALGPVFARTFRAPGWRVLNAGPCPENMTAPIRRLAPQQLLLLDAAEMGLPPGTLRRLSPDALTAPSFGTHAPSLAQLAAYLAPDIPSLHILGIQPASLRPGDRLSAPVRAALRTLASILRDGRLLDIPLLP